MKTCVLVWSARIGSGLVDNDVSETPERDPEVFARQAPWYVLGFRYFDVDDSFDVAALRTQQVPACSDNPSPAYFIGAEFLDEDGVQQEPELTSYVRDNLLFALDGRPDARIAKTRVPGFCLVADQGDELISV